MNYLRFKVTHLKLKFTFKKNCICFYHSQIILLCIDNIIDVAL